MLGRRKHVAIDYDRREIRLVVYEYVRKAPAILSMHTAAIPPDVDVSDTASLGQFLKTVIGRLGLEGARAVMCVGRAQAVLKSLTLPATAKANELAPMVQYQVSKELPFSAEEAVIDYTRGSHWDTEQPPPEEGVTVLAAAVRLPVVDAASGVCADAGLSLQRLGLRPYANLRAVYRCVPAGSGKRMLLVNITADEAEIDVMRDEILEFSRAATVAGPAEAPSRPPEAPRPADAVRRIVSEVTRSLHSFHAVQRGARIDAVLLAGSTGLENQAGAALADRLGVRCELLDVSRGFAVRRGEVASAFAAALGLAAGHAAEALPFDFLNPKRAVAPVNTRRIAAVVIAAAAALLCVGAVLGTHLRLRSRRAAITGLQNQKKQLVQANRDLKKLRQRVQDLKGWLQEDVCWLDELAHLSRTLPAGEELYLNSLRCGAGGAGGTKKHRGKITLAGRVKNNQTVPRFEEKLSASPGYNVSHKGTSPVGDKFGYQVKFTVDVLVGSAGGKRGGEKSRR